MKKSRFMSITLALILVLLTCIGFFTGCGTSNNETATNVSTSASSTKTDNIPASKPPAKLTFMMSDSGVATPDSFDPNNNPYIKEISKLANVELEVTRPLYADYRQKFTLMLSSGQIPDVVHSLGYAEDINKTGMAGGFVPLNDYINKSSILKSIHSEEILNSKKTTDGKIYGFPAKAGNNPNYLLARVDLIDSVNGGKIPLTPEDWYEFAKKSKEKYPDSIPFSSQGLFGRMDQFFIAYGVSPSIWYSIINEKIVPSLNSPAMKEAITYYRKLYSEGLIDANFITNKWPDCATALYEKNMLARNSNAIELQAFMSEFSKRGMKSKSLGAVPMPVAKGYKPLLYKNTVGIHTLSISSKCKDIDAAIRLIETLISPKVNTLANWGIEGIDYKVENGKKTLIFPSAESTSYRQMYNFMIEFYDSDAFEVSAQVMAKNFSDPNEKKYIESVWNNSVNTYKNAYEPIIKINPFQLFQLNPDLSKKYLTTYSEKAMSIMTKAIVGQIGMEEFSVQADLIVKEVFGDGVIIGEYQKYYDTVKK